MLQARVIAACVLPILLGASAAQPPAAPPAPAPAGIAWLILVDDLHIDFRNTGRVRELLRTLSTALMRDGDVAAMRASGPSSIALGPTSDRASVDAASRKVSGNALAALEITEELKAPGGEIDVRLGVTFATASMLLDSVPASPVRRRVILYITNGYDSERGRALASLFARAARQEQVIVFAVNAAGLAGAAPRIDNRLDPEVWRQVVASRRQSLRAISEPTGGFALLDDVDGVEAMTRIRGAVLAVR